MGKAVKKILRCIIAVVVIAAAFVAGDYFNFNLLSLLGFHQGYTQEPLPSTDPHTADEVVDVRTVVPFDEEGYGAIEVEQQKVPYVIDVDFTPVLLQEAQLEKKLNIMTQKATASETAKKAGLFSIPVFKQTKAIVFHGEGTYYVDLSSLTSNDFVIDKDKKTITIYIPEVELSVNLLPDETEFFDSANGTLRFGEMQITPEQMTTLETQGIERITETLDEDEDAWETAKRFAKLSVKEIYEPLVTAQIDAAVKNANDEFAVPAYYNIVVEIREE